MLRLLKRKWQKIQAKKYKAVSVQRCSPMSNEFRKKNPKKAYFLVIWKTGELLIFLIIKPTTVIIRTHRGQLTTGRVHFWKSRKLVLFNKNRFT